MFLNKRLTLLKPATVILALSLSSFVAGQNNDKTTALESEATTSLSLLSQEAFNGEVSAQEKLGDINASGKLVPQSLLHAVDWYNKAAHNGSLSALTKLAVIFCNEKLPKIVRPSKCLNTLKLAAEQGSPFAQLELAKMAYSNKFGIGDLDLAKKLAQSANKQGIAKAKELIVKINKDYFQYFKKASPLTRELIASKFKRSTHTVRLASFKKKFNLQRFVLAQNLPKSQKLYTYNVGDLHVLALHYYHDEESALKAISALPESQQKLQPKVVSWKQVSENINH